MEPTTGIKKYLLSISGIIVLILLGIHLTCNLEKHLDLDLSDEMYYLMSGKTNQFIAFRVLYPFWYKMLSVLTSDSLQLFYLNQRILIILLPVCIYIILYELLDNFILCLLFSCLFLYSNTNIATEYIYNGILEALSIYKINNFTLCLICLFSYLILKIHKRGYSSISLLTIIFFILSYVRNEYCVLFLLCAVVYLYQFAIHLRKNKKERYLFIIFWIGAIVVINFYGLSILISDFSNLHYIFSYSWNYLDWNHLPVNITSDLVSPCVMAFGNPPGLIGYFLSNPAEFIYNILFNVYNMFIVNSFRIADILLPQVLVPYTDKGLFNYILVITFILLTGGSYLILYYKKIHTAVHSSLTRRNKLKSIFQYLYTVSFDYFRNNPVILFNLLIIFITIVGNIAFMYDPRYFIHFVPLLFYLIILLCNQLPGRKIIQYVAGLLLLLIIIFPPTFSDYLAKNKYPPVEKNITNTIEVIKNYMKENKKTAINILTNDGDYGQLVPGVTTYNYSLISMKTDPDSLSKYTDLEKYNIIVINKYKQVQSYLWFNRINVYTQTAGVFTKKELKYSKYISNIYLRK